MPQQNMNLLARECPTDTARGIGFRDEAAASTYNAAGSMSTAGQRA